MVDGNPIVSVRPLPALGNSLLNTKVPPLFGGK